MVPHLILFTYHNLPTRSNGYKLSKNFCHLKYSFSQRVINDWNSLPADVVQASNVDSFKFKFDFFGLNYLLPLINI